MNRRRSNFSQILLSLAALLVILVVGAGITFSWIEGGTTYSIESEDTVGVKTGVVPSSVNYSGTVILNPDTSNPVLDLTDYDETSNQYQNLFFSPVYSKDGQTFIFPINDSEGNVVTYRESNTNDIGTKFINFDFDVKAAKKCYLAFNEKPTILVDGAEIEDASAFRIMISYTNSDSEVQSHIFSTATTAQTSTVVNDVSGSTATLTTETFDDYLYNVLTPKKLFTYGGGDTGSIEVAIWLDSASADGATKLYGSEIEISLELIVVAEDVVAGFDAVTYESGAAVSNGFKGGSIKVGTTTYSEKFSTSGTTFTATAVPDTDAGYKFVGWYSDKACTDGNLITSSEKLSHTPDDDITYYAKFEKINTTTIYIEERSGFSKYSVYAYQKTSSGTTYFTGTGASSTNNWPGGTATLDSETGYYKYEFTTTNTGTFNVIISNNGSSQYPGSGVEGLQGTLGGTYLFKAGSPTALTEFSPADLITFNVSALTGGTAKVNDGSTSVKISSGTGVKITATPTSGYTFAGWYTDSACTETIGTSYKTAEQTVTVTGDPGSTVTYYAKFEESSSNVTTIYFAERDGYSTYYAWVYNYSDHNIHYTGGKSWPGAQATYDSATGYYKYTFETTDTGQFRVIVSNNGSSQYPSSDGLVGTIGGTYLFSGTTMTTFDPSQVTPSTDVTITFNASSTTWVADSSAVVYLKDNSTGTQYAMTRTSSTSYTWTATVPSTVTNITFNRNKSDNSTTWNHWDAGSRGTKTTYKTSGDGTGSWQ